MADHSHWLPKLVDDGTVEALGHVHQAVDLLPPGVTEHGLDDMVAAVLRAKRPECGRVSTSRSVFPNRQLIRGNWKIKPVELDLLARRVSDDRDVATLGRLVHSAAARRGGAGLA
ncbi:hypothetical protein [Streptomyces sp. NPDC005262]|uniref:hypothetical protein n=1 Tax=Streptomyces sp. NPDC005262 TaxID=3364710 RepID=UPI0036797CFA